MSGSLGNLAVKVDADIAPLSANFDKAAVIAKTRMGDASSSVDDFRAGLLRASDDMQRAALEIGRSMGAANDAIISGSARSVDAINGIGKSASSANFEPLGQKIAEGISDGVEAGMDDAQSSMDSFVEASKTKALIIGVAVGAIFAAVGLGALYTAYRVVSATAGLVTGLFTGETYKSENIDALIEANNAVKEFQASLSLTAQQASATGAALATMGVDSKDYVKTFTGAADAVRTNTDELDRLGVKYKDAKGSILPLSEVIQSANAVLNEYTEGWDRNQAATAIGLGSAAAVAAAASVTADKITEAKDRLDDYNLGIGSETQAAVKDYQDAMQAFNRETDLTSQGFKRAISDSIMPMLTDLATFFKDGFPSAVLVFRDALALVVTLFYGLKTAVYAVAESVLGSIEAIGTGIGALAVAAARALTGDFSGARDAMVKGWADAKDRMAQIGDNIVAQHQHNAAAVRLAWASDDRAATNAAKPPPGKSFVPAPDDPDTSSSTKRDPFPVELNNLGRTQASIDFVIANFDKFQGKVKESKAAMAEFDVTLGKFADSQRAQDGFKPLTAEQKADYIQRNQLVDQGLQLEKQMQTLKKFDNASQQFSFKEQQSLDARKQDIEWMGKGQVELAKLTEARRIDGLVAAQINQTQIELGKSGLTITQAQIDALVARADAAKLASADLIQKADDKSRDPWFNASESIRKYGEQAANTGAQIGSAIAEGMKAAEDATVNFAMTGKLSISSLANSVVAEFTRMQVRAASSGLMGMLADVAGNFFGARATDNIAANVAADVPSSGGSGGGIDAAAGGSWATGGYISGPGTGTSDEIRAWLSNGEFVNNAESTKKNRALLEYLNNGGNAANAPRFSAGGMVGGGAAAASEISSSGDINIQLNNQTGTPMQASASKDSAGMISILLTQIEASLAGNVSAGRGKLNGAIKSRYGIKAVV